MFGDFSANFGLGLEHSELGAFFAQDPRIGVGGVCNPNTGPASVTCINLKGHPQTYAPDFTFNISAQYNFKLADGDTLTPAVNFSHLSSQWGTLFDNRAAGDFLAARDILGATLTWTHGSIVTTLYGYNLNDDQYVSALLAPFAWRATRASSASGVMKVF